MFRRFFLLILATASLAPVASSQSYMENYFSAINQNMFLMSPELRKAMRDANARSSQSTGTQSSGAGVANSTNSGMSAMTTEAALAASNFEPALEERGKAIDTLLSGIPAGPQRDAQRVRIETLLPSIETSLGPLKNNLAEMTYLLIGVSVQTLTGRKLETSQAQALNRSIALVYAGNEGLKHLDIRQRSQLYYIFAATIALEQGLALSKDPNEARAGKLVAQNTLKALGFQP